MKGKLLTFSLVLAIISVVGIVSTVLAGEPKPKPKKAGKDLVIYSQQRSVIPYLKCNLPSSEQFVKVDKTGIHWKWKNKSNDWCWWGIQDLPTNDIKPYLENGYLVIEFKGEYMGRSPEVSFIDKSNDKTSMVKFEGNFTEGEDTTAKGATVKIPLKKFFGEEEEFRPAEPSEIFELKFDAEYNSVRGELSISYIAIITDIAITTDGKKEEKKD
ncbi:secreted protein [Candidatus Magnetobacterium bavaricum]|uniref:Secreted protein n=1 Tax=Candidatus Magnetobacterium bavaricum TaxID=29290 RepID=A0A0F3GKQ6_9BACT|nr:secreted protein [Candidatus Magnetobacterium bavaricum]